MRQSKGLGRLAVLCVSVATALASLTGLTAAADTSILTNPDFQITAGTGWVLPEAGASIAEIASRNGEGTTSALKLENTSDDSIEDTTTITVSQAFTVAAATKYEVSVYFNLAARASENATDGAKVSVANSAGTEIATTEAFTLLDKGWRKALLVIPKSNTETSLSLKLSLQGTGLVYFDDAEVKVNTDLLVNGTMEGMQSDYLPTGWKFTTTADGSGATTTYSTDYGAIATDALRGNYYTCNNTKNYTGMSYQFDQGQLINGQRYKVTLDYKAAQYGLGFTHNIGALVEAATNANGYYLKYFHMLPNFLPLSGSEADGADWTENFTYYFTCDIKNSAAFKIAFLSQFGSLAGGERSFDNVQVEAVDSTPVLTFVREGNKLSASYKGFASSYLPDWTALGYQAANTIEEAQEMKANGITNSKLSGSDGIKEFEVGEKVSLLITLYEKTADGTLRAVKMELKNGQATTTLYPSRSGMQIQLIARNENPLQFATDSITVPDDGKTYVAKAFAWSGSGSVTPVLAMLDL